MGVKSGLNVRCQVSLWPNPQPHKSFKNAANALPTSYNKNAYHAFVRNFGTHYIKSALMGGSIDVETAVHANYTKKLTDIQIREMVIHAMHATTVTYGVIPGHE